MLTRPSAHLLVLGESAPSSFAVSQELEQCPLKSLLGHGLPSTGLLFLCNLVSISVK